MRLWLGDLWTRWKCYNWAAMIMWLGIHSLCWPVDEKVTVIIIQVLNKIYLKLLHWLLPVATDLQCTPQNMHSSNHDSMLTPEMYSEGSNWIGRITWYVVSIIAPHPKQCCRVPALTVRVFLHKSCQLKKCIVLKWLSLLSRQELPGNPT